MCAEFIDRARDVDRGTTAIAAVAFLKRFGRGVQDWFSGCDALCVRTQESAGQGLRLGIRRDYFFAGLEV